MSTSDLFESSLTNMEWLTKFNQRETHEALSVTSNGSHSFDELTRLKMRTQASSSDERPNVSYTTLIMTALRSAPDGKMTLGDIYEWIIFHFPYYKNAGPSWKNSIRHNLSFSKLFKKVPRKPGYPGKGAFWTIDTDYIEAAEEQGNSKPADPQKGKKRSSSFDEVSLDNHQFHNIQRETDHQQLLYPHPQQYSANSSLTFIPVYSRPIVPDGLPKMLPPVGNSTIAQNSMGEYNDLSTSATLRMLRDLIHPENTTVPTQYATTDNQLGFNQYQPLSNEPIPNFFDSYSSLSFALGGVGTTTKTTQKNAIPSATQSMTGDRDQNTQPVVEDAEEFDYTRLI